MKKKKIIIVVIVIAVILMLVPIPSRLKDGGSIEYKAVLYKITKVHRINLDSPTGYDEGIIIKLLGKKIYDNVIVNVKVNDLKKDDIINEEENLLFSINWMDRDCIPIQLTFYDNNKYILCTHYEECSPKETCNMMLVYTKYDEGVYDYDVMKIIQNSRDADNLTFTNDNRPDYEIYAGKDQHMYVAYDSNQYLKELLKEINIDLKQCAKPDYK